jgi:RHH-type proline utilization regulon transcriptional repressor/proline dehydrogenase/delta 1-pyrroline-5-carboxylate dehydrogenase
VYAPVGSHEDLLPYLVRRLLENGSNTSFVNRISDEQLPVKELIADPVEIAKSQTIKPHPRIPLPVALYGDHRKNSMGLNLANTEELRALARDVNQAVKPWRAEPLIPGYKSTQPLHPVTDPSDRRRGIGSWIPADPQGIEQALANAVAAQPRGMRPRPARAHVRSSTPRTCSSSAAPSSSRCACARPARRSPTPWPRCAKPPTSAATTRPRDGGSSARPCRCRARPAKRTS